MKRARSPRPISAIQALVALFSVACQPIEDPSLTPPPEERFDAAAPSARNLGHDPLKNVFWGDLHIHTSHSYDAYTFGVRALPDDAYVFARGGTIQHALGYPIRARRPLDFAAVTDHAEYLGVARSLAKASALQGESATPLAEIMRSGNRLRITFNFLKTTLSSMGSVDTREETFGAADRQVSAQAWHDIVSAAARHDDPGRFTTFVGYEWTSMPSEENLHRNVIYKSERTPSRPFSSRDSDNPEDLWRALDDQRAQGMEMISIPHNANVSNGRMYARKKFDGSPLDAAYAVARMKNEPISEILQVKGQSETHPILSSEDEFSSFELFDEVMSTESIPSEPRGSYARDALRAGLEMSAGHGWNPYRFGFIGSSDSHNASSSVEEDDFHGKLPMIDGSAGLRLGETILLPKDQLRSLKWGAAGLAAAWAEENTRVSLFDALRRKETYATSGPRITVRFFGGWNFEPGLVEEPEFIARAYASGVPMGGELPRPPEPSAPHFAVFALKDPLAANLDRVQIVKGWVDSQGRSHERIFDVAASDGRVAAPGSHRVVPVGNSVDVESASYTNTIGAAQLAAVWRDPDFDPEREAFWYVRVLEIPTPRWSTHDALLLGISAPEPSTIQERAITSAIWYQPSAKDPAVSPTSPPRVEE